MNTVTGVFDSVADAECAVKSLMNAGFDDDHIGLVVTDTTKGPTLADDLGREYASATAPGSHITSRSTVYGQLPEDFVNHIRRAEMPDDAVNWYHDKLNQGYILVVTDSGDRMDDASRAVRSCDGMLYASERRTMTRPPAETTMRETTASEMRMPVVEEQVSVEKTQHQVGEVEVTKETTQRDVDIPATLMHEEVYIERRSLDKPLRPEDYKTTTPTEGVIRMPIIEEEVRVVKEPVVREELILRRVPVSEQKTFHERVSHTEPHVETKGDVNLRKEGDQKRRPAA